MSSTNDTGNSIKGVNAPSQPSQNVAGTATHLMLMKPQPHLISQAQPHAHGGSQFAGHFQLADPHAQFQVHGHSLGQNACAGSVGASSPSVSMLGTGGVKRVQPRPPSRPPGSSVTSTASPLKTMELVPAARRKRPRPPANRIPDKVAALVPGSSLYSQLLELESQIDAVLARKKIDVQGSLRIPRTVQKTLRVYIFNTYSNQEQSNTEEGNTEPPSWTLKIGGKILENGGECEVSRTGCRDSSWYPKFSYFFKRIAIYLDQGLYPNNYVILWENARSPAPCDGFEVKRSGDKEFTVMLRLEMNYMPERFKLSPALMEVLGIEIDSRPRIMAALWHYVKFKKLQSPKDPSLFLCDMPLRKVFGEEKMKFSMVPQKLSHHLSPPQPIHLQHEIKLSGNCPTGNTCYDMVVDVPFQFEEQMKAFLLATEKQDEINACDETISAALERLDEHYLRRAFFLGFSQSPVEFINFLIASQGRDLKLAAGDPSHDAGKEHGADFYSQQWVEDAVIHYLNRKNASGTDAP